MENQSLAIRVAFKMKNLFEVPDQKLTDERIDTLLQSPGVRVERIVSMGHASPENFWYDQAEAEWVLVIQGRAALEFDDGEVIALTAGDYCMIPPHRSHRVQFTDNKTPTIWLAIFLTTNEGDLQHENLPDHSKPE